MSGTDGRAGTVFDLGPWFVQPTVVGRLSGRRQAHRGHCVDADDHVVLRCLLQEKLGLGPPNVNECIRMGRQLQQVGNDDEVNEKCGSSSIHRPEVLVQPGEGLAGAVGLRKGVAALVDDELLELGRRAEQLVVRELRGFVGEEKVVLAVEHQHGHRDPSRGATHHNLHNVAVDTFLLCETCDGWHLSNFVRLVMGGTYRLVMGGTYLGGTYLSVDRRPVQPPERSVEHRGEADPGPVRQQQGSWQRVNPPEENHGDPDGDPEHGDLDQRQPGRLHAEEQNRPQSVEGELDREHGQRDPDPVHIEACAPDEERGHSHHDVQHGPHRTEDPGRWVE